MRSRYTLLLSARGRRASVADADHLGAAVLALLRLPRECARGTAVASDRSRPRSTCRCASSMPVSGLRLHAAVMADVGDPAVPLAVDGGLIRAACLQIVVADELHVALLPFVLRDGRRTERDGKADDE